MKIYKPLKRNYQKCCKALPPVIKFTGGLGIKKYTYTMEINVKLEITRETLESIFVTALEDGSNHWYWIHEDTYRLIRNHIPTKMESCLSMALFSCVYDIGLRLPIHDAEDSHGEAIGYLDRMFFAKRLQKCHDELPFAINNELNEQGDAESSDIIFQYLCLNDYVYC
jgi:hypothetical protein